MRLAGRGARRVHSTLRPKSARLLPNSHHGGIRLANRPDDGFDRRAPDQRQPSHARSRPNGSMSPADEAPREPGCGSNTCPMSVCCEIGKFQGGHRRVMTTAAESPNVHP